MPTIRTPAALGFNVHTGWAAMIALHGPATSPTVVDRRRVEMIAGHDPGAPPFVYHAAAKLSLAAAERLIDRCAREAHTQAQAAVRAAVDELRERGYDVVGGGVIVGNKPFGAPLQSILKAHSLIHSAEGELFRRTIIVATEACGLPVTTLSARELSPRGAKLLRLSDAALEQLVAKVGRAAGRPWARDQKASFVMALVALCDSAPPS